MVHFDVFLGYLKCWNVVVDALWSSFLNEIIFFRHFLWQLVAWQLFFIRIDIVEL